MTITFCDKLPLLDSFTQHHSETIREAFKTQPVCIGIDEAGRGPVLGPMVYAIGFCPSSMHKQLKDKGMDGLFELFAFMPIINMC
jgi:ribonuclease HIII